MNGLVLGLVLRLRAVVFVFAFVVVAGGVGDGVAAVSASSYEVLETGPAGEAVEAWFGGCGAGCGHCCEVWSVNLSCPFGR